MFYPTLTFFASKIWFPLYFPGLVFFLSDIFTLLLRTFSVLSVQNNTRGSSFSFHLNLNTKRGSGFGWKRTSYTPKRLRWCCSHLASGPWSFLNWTPHPSLTRRPSSWCFRYSSRSYLVKPHFFETKIWNLGKGKNCVLQTFN